MRFRSLLLFIVFSAFIFTAAHGQTTVPGDNFGYIQGSFGVSDGGAATYSIPLTLPQGTAGLQPSIGLSYNSNSGNGIVGVGWNLQGLSSIVRSGRNRSQDENTDKDSLTKAVSYALTYSNQDRFVLDGQRLVLAPESILAGQQFDINYGNNETVYQKEQDDFTKVVFYTNASGGYFKAFTKDGLIYFYGNATDAKVISNNVAIVWKVNRIEDRKGNYITFSYSYDAATGEILPTQINYTGNANTGLQAYNSVVFDYENRPDFSTSYGIRYQQKSTFTKRLQKIRTLYQGALVREYRLTYQLNGFSTLSQITECDAGGNCLVPTVFNWQTPSVTSSSTPIEVSGLSSSTINPDKFGDFNGDGLLDVITYTASERVVDPGTPYYKLITVDVTVLQNTGNGQFLNVFSANIREYYYSFYAYDFKLRVADFNGDSIDDFIVTFNDDNDAHQFLSNPNQLYPYQVSFLKRDIIIPNANDNRLIDLNGDGIVDFWRTNTAPTYSFTSEIRSYYKNSDLTTYRTQSDIQSCQGSVFSERLFFDINADGLNDILFYNPINGENVLVTAYSNLVNSTSSERINQFQVAYNPCSKNAINTLHLQTSSSPDVNYSTEDLNGDNLKDIVIFHGATQLFKIIPNKGNSGFDTPITIPSPTYNSASVFVGYPKMMLNDYDADGQIDLVFYNATTGINITYLNIGNFSFNFNSPYINLFPVDVFKSGTNRWFRIGIFKKNSLADVIYRVGSSVYMTSLGKKTNTLLTSLTEGTKHKTEIEYSNLLDQDVHGRIGTGRYPYIDVQIPINVVKKYRTVAVNGEKRSKTYTYLGGAIHVEGRGFRGFVLTLTKDSITNRQDLKTAFFAKDAWRYAANNTYASYELYQGKKVKTTENNPAFVTFPLGMPTNQFHRAKSFYCFNKSQLMIDSLSGKKLTMRQDVDDGGRYGNMKYIMNDYGFGLKDSTVYTYYNDAQNWIIGRPLTVTKYHFAPNQTTFIEQESYEYELSTGLMTKEVKFSNLSQQERIETTMTYDAYGNVIQTDVKAWNGATFETRTQKQTFDAKGRFALTSTNALNQISSSTYDERLGVVLTVKDPNDLILQSQYDGFGRVIKQTNPDGTWTTNAFRKADATLFGSPAGAVFLTYGQSSDGQISLTHFDSYGRKIEDRKKGFDGQQEIVNRTDYGWNGILENTTNSYPFYRGGTPVGYAQTEYDVFGRTSKLIQTKTGGTKTATTVYGWLTNVNTNFLGQVQTITYNTKDQIVQSAWNNVTTLSYNYDAAGRPASVIDLKGNTYTTVIDSRGNKTQMTDPDMGTYRYEYNGFGELTKQTYPNGKVVTMEYDKLGRMTKKTDEEGVTTWQYDVGNKAIGKVTEENGYFAKITYAYDTYGRKNQETLRVENIDYTTRYTYDVQGRPLTLTYPSGLVMKYIYNAQGYLSELRNNATNALFWKVTEMDAPGNVTKQQYGNNVITEKQFEAATQFLTSIKSTINNTVLQQFSYSLDDLGNLLQRQDVKRTKAEQFTYDSYNRLTQSSIAGRTTVNMTYDELGNIISKSDVGIFEYGSVNNGPHRLTQIRSNTPTVPCSFAENITTLYTSFNKVSRIANDTSYVEINYGPDMMRLMQKMYVRNSLVRTKLYIGGLAEIETYANGRKITTNYLNGKGIHVTEQQGASTTTKTQYLLTDHLGSITGFTGDNGALIDELSFDAWGKRRNADWTPLTTVYEGFERGFTYHEHYDLFSMVEMNGRVYDPVVGRFLSPDILIQDELDVQNYNRYSYVLNNPLKYIDPTGYAGQRVYNQPIGPNLPKNSGGYSIVNAYGSNSSYGEYGLIAGSTNYEIYNLSQSNNNHFNNAINDGILRIAEIDARVQNMTSKHLSVESESWSKITKPYEAMANSLKENAGKVMIGSNMEAYYPTKRDFVFLGNQYVNTYSLSKVGEVASKITGSISLATDVGQIYGGYIEDGGRLGDRTKQEIRGVIGDKIGSQFGMWTGRVIGTPYGPAGMVIGGAVGSWLFGTIGSELGKAYKGEPFLTPRVEYDAHNYQTNALFYRGGVLPTKLK